MKKKFLSFLTLLFIAAALLPANVTVFAASSGSCGEDLTWTLDDNGTLTISGTGDMTDFGVSPWESDIINVIIKKGVTSIGDFAFYDCRSLTSITIPEGVTNIGYNAFSYCRNLTSITIPESLTSIGHFPFMGCDSLTSINVDANNNDYCSVDGNLFNKTKTELIKYAVGKSDTEYIIPNSVTRIEEYAFGGCESLTSIAMPEGVTKINEGTFINCQNLASITIPKGVTYIGNNAFYNCRSLTSITIPNSVTDIISGAFCGCASLKSISIPEGVTSIEDETFSYCSSLTSITIPDSVTSIGYRAFGGCSSLTNITIPNSVTSIGEWAFEECGNLKTVYYKGNKSEWNNIDIEEYGNSCLKNAEIIYLKQTNLNVSKEGNTITVKPVNIESGNVVILALYNEKGLVEMQEKPYAGIDIPFTTDKTYTSAKVMVWDSLESMKPICTAETVD